LYIGVINTLIISVDRYNVQYFCTESIWLIRYAYDWGSTFLDTIEEYGGDLLAMCINLQFSCITDII